MRKINIAFLFFILGTLLHNDDEQNKNGFWEGRTNSVLPEIEIHIGLLLLRLLHLDYERGFGFVSIYLYV
jgi:hypothetical protein